MKKVLSIMLSMVLVLCMCGGTIAFASVDPNKQYEEAFAKIAEKYNVEDLTYEAGEDTYKTKSLDEFKKWAEEVCKFEENTRKELEEINKTTISEEEMAQLPTTFFTSYTEYQHKDTNVYGITAMANYRVNSPDGRLSYIDSGSYLSKQDYTGNNYIYYSSSVIKTYVSSYTVGNKNYAYQDNTCSIVVTCSNNTIVTTSGEVLKGVTNYARFYAL